MHVLLWNGWWLNDWLNRCFGSYLEVIDVIDPNELTDVLDVVDLVDACELVDVNEIGRIAVSWSCESIVL